MKKLNGGIVVLAVMAVVWFLQPSQVMAVDPERLTIEQLKNMLSDDAADVIVIDTRSLSSYEAGHIPGALPMPFPDGLRAGAEALPRKKTILLY